MAISNLVKSSGYVNKPSIAGMFGKGAANDNLVKDSGLFSESFIVSASNSIMQLNDNLSKLQESSLSIIKSIDDIISKIRTLDKDMTQRFKKLNADITASRPEFGKFLVKAPPVPLADFAPGIIEQGKVANATGGGIPPIVPLPITPRSKTPGGGGAGGGSRGGSPRTQTPGGGGKGTTGSGKDPMKTAPKPATPTARVSSPPSPRGAPSGTPEYKIGMMKPTPRAELSGAPTRAPAIDGKTAARGALERADRVLPRALSRAIGPLAIAVETGMAYVKYKDAVEQYDTDIENKVDPKKAQETLDASIAEIIGETVGSLLGGFGGAAIGGALGTAVPGIGNLFGSVAGGVIGSMAGNDIGMIIGKSVGDTYKDDSVNFEDAFKKRWSDFSQGRYKQTQEDIRSAVGGRVARQRRQMGLPPLPEAAGAPPSSPAAPVATAPSAPPADSASAGEKKEEDGSSGSTSAPTGEAVPDPTKVKGTTPQSSTPAPSTPSAPPPTPRVDRTGGGGTNVQVNNTTNSSSTTRGGDNQNVTNPNMKLNAQNEFLTNSLSRQMINVA
jgi:hypothetical protein